MIDPNGLCVKIIHDSLGVEVSTEIPHERPDGDFVQVSQSGGDETPFLSRPIMTLICWSSTDASAYSLGMDCIHAIAAQAEDDPYLSASELLSLSRDEWSGNGQSRYMAQVRLTINKD